MTTDFTPEAAYARAALKAVIEFWPDDLTGIKLEVEKKQPELQARGIYLKLQQEINNRIFFVRFHFTQEALGYWNEPYLRGVVQQMHRSLLRAHGDPKES